MYFWRLDCQRIMQITAHHWVIHVALSLLEILSTRGSTGKGYRLHCGTECRLLKAPHSRTNIFYAGAASACRMHSKWCLDTQGAPASAGVDTSCAPAASPCVTTSHPLTLTALHWVTSCDIILADFDLKLLKSQKAR